MPRQAPTPASQVPAGRPDLSVPSQAVNTTERTPAPANHTPLPRPGLPANQALGSTATNDQPRSASGNIVNPSTGPGPMLMTDGLQAVLEEVRKPGQFPVLVIRNDARMYNNSSNNGSTSAGETVRRRAITSGCVAGEESDNTNEPGRPTAYPNGKGTSWTWLVIGAFFAWLFLVHMVHDLWGEGAPGFDLPKDIKIASAEDRFAPGSGLIESIDQSLRNEAVSQAYKVKIRELSGQASVNQRNTTLGYQDLSDSPRSVLTLGWSDEAAARSTSSALISATSSLLHSVWPWYPDQQQQPTDGLAMANNFLQMTHRLNRTATTYIDGLGKWNATAMQIFDVLEPERISAIDHATLGKPSKYRHPVDYIRNYNVVPPNVDVRVLNSVGVSVCRTGEMVGSLVEIALRAQKETVEAERVVDGAKNKCKERRKGCGSLKELVGGKAGRVVSAWLMEPGKED
ncbi:MAG: hypothetical protein LQ346_006501 [Caloplaca aetnensis]|nr:MAG: hypothetical protein LQ346_006501 [Caloplaca aetnensis]